MNGIVFSFMAGAVATVNPCGFALLPAYLARRLAPESGSGPISGALRAGAATTLGFMTVFGVIGTLAALGSIWITGETVAWLGIGLGGILVILGIATLVGRVPRLALHMPAAADRSTTLAGDFLFGSAYGAVSLSCTLPIFLAVAGSATTFGIVGSAASLTAYGLGMGTVFTALAVAVATSREGVVRRLGAARRYVTMLGGLLLIGSGLYVGIYWSGVAGLLGPDAANNPIIASGVTVSEVLRRFMVQTIGVPGVATLLAAIGLLWGVRRWRRKHRG